MVGATASMLQNSLTHMHMPATQTTKHIHAIFCIHLTTANHIHVFSGVNGTVAIVTH